MHVFPPAPTRTCELACWYTYIMRMCAHRYIRTYVCLLAGMHISAITCSCMHLTWAGAPVPKNHFTEIRAHWNLFNRNLCAFELDLVCLTRPPVMIPSSSVLTEETLVRHCKHMDKSTQSFPDHMCLRLCPDIWHTIASGRCAE